MDEAAVKSMLADVFLKALTVHRNGRTDVLSWGKRYFPDYFTKPSGRHHKLIAERFPVWNHKRNVRAVIVSPRGSAKTTELTFLLPMWAICHGLEKYIILFADTNAQAIKYVKAIQNELTNNPKLAEDYPHACGVGKEWNTDGILTRNGIRVEPLGTEQKVRGRKELHRRPSLLVIDDPEGDDAAYSAARRESVWDWATKGVFKAGDRSPEVGTNIIMGGTMVHRECLVGRCANLPGWETMLFKSIESWPVRMDLWDEWERVLRRNPAAGEINAWEFYQTHKKEMDRGARVLWNENETLYDLMMIRATEGHPAFESEKQNNPVDPARCEWPPDYFKGEDLWFDDWPDDCEAVVSALDPSKGKEAKAGDYQAIVTAGVKGRFIYVDADIRRQSVVDMMGTLLDHCAMFKSDVGVVEDVQFQELIVPMCEDEAISRKLLVPLEGLTTGNKPKLRRIRRLGPYINRGRFKFRRGSSGAALLVQQLMDVPTGEFDDGPDALEMAVRRLALLLNGGDNDSGDNPF